MYAVALLQGEKPFQYDAHVYWDLAQTFSADGGFSLLNFDSPLRGYLFPLTNLALQDTLGRLELDASASVKLFNAAVFALIATVLAPRLAALAWPQRPWGFWPRIGLAVLLLVFWRSYLNFPLSDFPALAAVLLALIAGARAESLGWMLVAGLATGAAINMRPAYLLLAPIVVTLIGFAWWEGRGAERALGRRTACALLCIAGFTAISLPQSLASQRHHDTISFLPGTAAGLSGLQFTEGLRLQRYETYVGQGQPGPRMLYIDESGSRVLSERNDGRVDDVAELIGIVANEPFTMAGVFARHLINGLDQRYDTPYVERLDTGSQRPLRLAGFLLAYLTIVRLVWPTARRGLGTTRWRWIAALPLTALTSLVSAVETRFLLPVYLLTYIVAVTPGWPNPLLSDQPRARRALAPVAVAVGLAIYLAVVLNVVADTTERLSFGG